MTQEEKDEFYYKLKAKSEHMEGQAAGWGCAFLIALGAIFVLAMFIEILNSL